MVTTRRRTRRTAALALTAALGIGLAACGDADPAPTAADDTAADDAGTDDAGTDDADTDDPVDDEPHGDPVDDGTTEPATADPDTGAPSASDDDPRPVAGDDRLPFPMDTRDDTAEPSEFAALGLTGVRLGRADRVDRVVFELAGRGEPGWWVGYVDDPRTQGEGAAVELPGGAVLEVDITGVAPPPDTGVPWYDGPRERTASDLQEITVVRVGGVFEGISQHFVGVDEELPFRAYLLADPTRLVVEVARPS